MDKKYWDDKAGRYEDEIFSSFHEDVKGVIKRNISKYSSPGMDAADFGCGVGLYSPYLSRNFRNVYSYDLSPELIAEASERNTELDNVLYRTADLVKDKLEIKKIKFAVCANVLITADYSVRKSILENITGYMRRGGVIFFVLPSLESALFANYMMFSWNIKDGLDQKEAIKAGMKSQHHGYDCSVSDGLVKIDGVTTKHYLREEINSWFPEFGLKPLKIEKIEYSWETEFEDPPGWMNTGNPWDWMVIAKKL